MRAAADDKLELDGLSSRVTTADFSSISRMEMTPRVTGVRTGIATPKLPTLRTNTEKAAGKAKVMMVLHLDWAHKPVVG